MKKSPEPANLQSPARGGEFQAAACFGIATLQSNGSMKYQHKPKNELAIMTTKTAPKKVKTNRNSKPARSRPHLSREELETTLSSEPKSFIHAGYICLEIVADINDHRILKDENGHYYMDRAVSTAYKNFCAGELEEYAVERQRRKVSPGEAIEQIMLAAIPHDLLKRLPRHWERFVKLADS